MTIKDKITELENLSEGSFFQSNPRAQKIKAILDEDGNNIFHTIIHENNVAALQQVLTATQLVPTAVVDALTTTNQAGQTAKRE